MCVVVSVNGRNAPNVCGFVCLAAGVRQMCLVVGVW